MSCKDIRYNKKSKKLLSKQFWTNITLKLKYEKFNFHLTRNDTYFTEAIVRENIKQFSATNLKQMFNR